MSSTTVGEYIEGAQVSESLRRAQVKSAGTIIAQFLLVREGLAGRVITDKEMVELAQELQGWTESVYKFGCAFIHLSGLHDYNSRDPLSLVSEIGRAHV